MHPERIRHLRGTSYEIGFAMGRALGPRLDQNIAAYLRKRPSRPDAADFDALNTQALPWLKSLPARFQDEFTGLADGAQIPLQCLAEWAYVEQCVNDGCSAFICRLDHQIWVGRNNDMFVPDMWGYLIIREVNGRIPTMSFGLEGDVFTSTGFNREKLWLHCHFLPAHDASRSDRLHLPSYVFLPEALETCTNLREVEALLESIDRTDGMMLFAVDGKTNDFAVFECSCRSHRKREGDGKWLVGTNHFCTRPEFAASTNSAQRYCRLEERVSTLVDMRLKPCLPADLIAILADSGVEQRAQNFGTVYANVACPGRGQVWYTFGGYPAASHGDWREVAWAW